MKRFYKFLMPLVMIMALALPWQTNAQCGAGISSCEITVQMVDDYGDGWYDDEDNPCSILVYQGTTLRGTATLTDGLSGTQTIAVCNDDSIRFVWSGNDYYEEIGFSILNGDGSTLIANASGYNYTNNQTIITGMVICPSCIAPTNLAASVTGADVDITWTDNEASSWEIVWGIGNFDPDTVTLNIDYASTQSYSFTNMDDGVYTAYIRADCGGGDYSTWVPVNFSIMLNGCFITINATDSYGDGWNGNAINVLQGGVLVGSATIDNGSSATVQIPVASGTPVTLTYTSGSYASEMGGTVTDGSGMVVFTIANMSSYSSGATLATIADPCPTCFVPMNFTHTITGDDAVFTWSSNNASAWEVNYGAMGFNPDNETTNLATTTDTTFTIDTTTLSTGFYDVYVRTDCGGDDYSSWVGPITLSVGIMIINMPTTGTQTINTCNATIYDNGGATGQYSNSCNATIIVLPSNAGDWLTINGFSHTEGSWDYLTIYEGVGTSGDVLFCDNTSSDNTLHNFGPFQNDAFTISFYSDGSTVYDGFQVNVGCIPGPSCTRPESLTVTDITPDSVYISWVDSLGSEWIVACGPTGFSLSDTTNYIPFTDTYGAIGGLSPNSYYDIYLMTLCGGDTSLARMITVRTACSFIDSLPYTTSFENASTGSYTDFTFGDPCWTLTTNATQYPYVYVSSSSSYAHSGGKGIYWYRSSSTTANYGTYQCLVLPGVATDEDHPINAMQLKFWAKASSSSEHPIFQVGVMTNPGDINTFTTVGTVDINGVTDWTEYVVGLNNYTGTGRFVAIRANYEGAYWYAYLDDVTLEMAPNCPPITHINTMGASTSSAYLTWTLQEGLSGVPEEYEIEYVATDDSTATVATTTTTDPYVFLTGLTPNTEYKFRVRVDCGDDDYSPWDSTTFTTAGFGCLQVDTNTSFSDTINVGTATNTYIPSYSTYNYGLTQQIFTATEIGHGGAINSISFKPSAYSSQRSLEIYLGHISEATATNFVYPSDLTLVYSGTSLSLTANQWNEFQFTTEFPYNGSDNLLVMVRDMTGSWSSGNTWLGTNGANNVSRYIYQDSGPYTIGSTTGGTASNFRSSIILGGAACAVQATCAAPVAGILNVDSTSVTVGWAPGANETSWDAYYRIYGDSVWTSAATGVTATSYNFTNLNPGTNYEFRVSNNCSEGDFSTVVSATTACAAFHLPLTENFENVASGVYEPQCWVNGSTYLGTNYPNPLVVSLTGDPNKLLLFYNGGYLILPQVAAPLNQLQVRFKFVQGGDNVHFLMGLMPNQDMPIDSIIVLDTLVRSDIDTSTSTVFITYSLATIDPDYNNYHLAFWDAFNENYSFIDDLVVEYIPQCASVSGLSATATTNTATISWATDASSASGYIIEYGPRGFQLGTGTTTTATSSPATITGLAHSTNYDAYVYTICASLNDTSTVSPVVEFATECDVITTLPYSTTFEHILPPGSGSSVVMVPNCWATSVINSGTAPRIYYTTTTAMAPSPSYCLYFYDLGVAALPQMSMPLDSLMLSFHAYNATPSSYGLIIGAVDSITPGYAASFTPIDTVVFEYGNNNEYNLVSFLNGYTGSANHLAIRNYNVDSNATYATIYLDNLTVDYIPSCIAPQRVHTTMLTNVAADIEWTISNAPNYSIEYGPHGFTPGTGTTLTSTTNSISLTGLTPYTEYDVRLVSLCNATETSDTTVFTFTTLRAAPVTSYPYYCDFTDSAMAAAWEPVNGTQTNGWYVGTAAHYDPAATDQSLYISDDNGVSNSYTISSASNVTAYRTFALVAGSYNFSYNWKAYGESCCDYLRVFLVPASVEILPNVTNGVGSSSAPTGWISLDGGNKLNYVSSWQSYSEDITVTTPGSYHLVFFWHNDGSVGTQPPAAVDNISVARNVCPIDNIQATNVTGSSATITWTGNSDEYQVEYGISGFSQGTQVTTTTPTISLTGLTSLTPYQVKVRGICNGGVDTSRWYSYVFATDMCDNPTIAQNFDSTSTGTSSYSPLGYSYYNYGYVQTLIDSADMAAISGDITAMAFYPASTSQGDKYTNMDIYLANVPENSLSSGFIQPDSTTHVFVQVLTAGNLNYTTVGEQLVSFDAPFTWDGHSNVLVVVNRKHGSYSSGASFSAHTATVAKTRYAYQDGSAYDPYNITVSGTSSTTVGNLKLISCGGGCYAPSALHTTNVTYNSVSVAWSGTDSAEVGIHQGLWDETGATITTVTTNSYTFTGLTPNMQYTIAVRNLCPDDMTSVWTYLQVTTDDLPCFAPDSVVVSNQTPSGAKVTWRPNGNETEWLVNVFRSGVIDTNYTVINTPMCNVNGLYSAMTYTVKVGAVCGGIDTMWSDPTTLTTTACLPPTNVEAVANGHQAIVTWEGSGANEYHVLWFLEDFTTDGDSVIVTNSNTNATIDGLEGGETYDIYVYAYCDGQRSAQAGQTQLHVTGIDDINTSAINLYPNPANTTVTVDGIEGEALVTIVDMNGRTVFSEKTVSSITIDLNGMAKGAYFVRITGENSSAIRKLIVK